jgi:hypothetical protein
MTPALLIAAASGLAKADIFAICIYRNVYRMSTQR